MHDSLSNIGDAATGDPGAILGILVADTSISGSVDRFEAYVESECADEIAAADLPMGTPSTEPSTTDDVSTTTGSYPGTWDNSQYTFNFTAGFGNVTVEEPTMVDQDATLSFDWHLDLTVTNDESLGAEAPGRVFSVEGAWPLDSDLCVGAKDLDVLNPLVRYPTRGGLGSTTTDDEFPYCLVPLASAGSVISPELLNAPPIDAGSTQEVSLSDTFTAELPTDFADIAREDLEAGPDFWISDPFAIGVEQPIETCFDVAWASPEAPCLQIVEEDAVEVGGSLGEDWDHLYGACEGDVATILGFIDEGTMVAQCGTGIGVVDVEAETVDYVEGQLEGYEPTYDNSSAHLSGHTLAWNNITQYKAEGLNPRTWDMSLMLYDILTGETTEVPLVTGGPNAAPDPYDVYPNPDSAGFVVAVPGRALPAAVPGNWIIHFAPDGTEQWRRKLTEDRGLDTTYALEPVTRNTSLADGGHVLLDVRSGKVVDHWPGDVYAHFPDACATHSSIELYDAPQRWVTDSTDGISVEHLAGNFPSQVYTEMWNSPVGGLVDRKRVSMITPAGAVMWNIPRNVAREAWSIGKWVIVVNVSGQQILLGAATGEQAEPDDPAVSDVLLDTYPNSPYVWFSEDQEWAWVDTNESYRLVPTEALCGP